MIFFIFLTLAFIEYSETRVTRQPQPYRKQSLLENVYCSPHSTRTETHTQGATFLIKSRHV